MLLFAGKNFKTAANLLTQFIEDKEQSPKDK